jgi:tRNA acetyltransferase TAN1
VKETYKILDEYIDKLADAAALSEGNEADAKDDMEAQLALEVNQLKDAPKQYRQCQTKCKNILFVQALGQLDPIQIANSIFKDIEETGIQKARFAIRLIPVQKTCKASKETVETCVEELLTSLTELPAEVSYKIECKVRNNSDLSRMDLIEVAAVAIKKVRPNWKVDFDNAVITLNLDVLIKVCCVTFLKNFVHFSKYNLIEFSNKIKGVTKEDSAPNLKEKSEIDVIEPEEAEDVGLEEESTV